VDEKGRRGETAKNQSGRANQREIARLRLDSGKGQRATAGVEDCEKQEAANEQQIEASPAASNVEPGKARRVHEEERGEEQLFQREAS